MFHSFYGLVNSINWPALSVWVFIAQLVEHYSGNAEATGSNPVKAPENFLEGLIRNFTFNYFRNSHILILNIYVTIFYDNMQF